MKFEQLHYVTIQECVAAETDDGRTVLLSEGDHVSVSHTCVNWFGSKFYYGTALGRVNTRVFAPSPACSHPVLDPPPRD